MPGAPGLDSQTGDRRISTSSRVLPFSRREKTRIAQGETLGPHRTKEGAPRRVAKNPHTRQNIPK